MAFPFLLLAAAEEFDVAKLRWQASLTPLWILGMGVAAGLVLVALLILVLRLVFPRLGKLALANLREGAMWPLLWLTVAISALAVLATPSAIRPGRILDSLASWPSTGTREYQFEIAGPPAGKEAHETPPQEIGVYFRTDEVTKIRLSATVPLVVFSQPPDPALRLAKGGVAKEVAFGEQVEWNLRGEAAAAFGGSEAYALHVLNDSGQSGTLQLAVTTAPVHPEALDALWAAGLVVSVFVLYLLQAVCLPRVAAVALATTKSELAQPLFWILVAVGSFLVVLFLFVPYNTFGDDVKMLKTSCFDLILVISLIQAIWAAGNSVSEEIEGRTALTVLSKPLTRAQFVLGKFVGIAWTVFLMYALLGTFFLAVVSYKPLYDAVESTREDPLWQQVHAEVVRSLPGLALGLMQTLVLASLSVAVSTRLPLLANFVVSFSIYALGNITPVLVQSQSTSPALAPVRFVAQFVALLPMLEHFDTEAAVVSGSAVPLSYLAMAFVYSSVYAAIAMFLALLLFEDRDLA